jgi:hypothetical protein
LPPSGGFNAKLVFILSKKVKKGKKGLTFYKTQWDI